jgi:hypothetical protein
MPKVYKSQLIELVSNGISGGNSATKIQFTDQPYLRNKHITGIEILNVRDMAVSPTGNTVIDNTTMLKSYLTLYLTDPSNPSNVGEWIQLVPFTDLHRIQNASNDPFARQMYELQSPTIYWEKCYITLGSAIGNTSNVSFLFNVYFKD